MPRTHRRARATQRHLVQPEHRLQPALLPLARRLSHRRVPAQLRRLRQRARLRGAAPTRARSSTPGCRPPATAPATSAASCSTTTAATPLGGDLTPTAASRPARARRLVRLRRAPRRSTTAPPSATTARPVIEGTGRARLHDPGHEPRGARLRPRREGRSRAPSSSCSPTSPRTPAQTHRAGPVRRRRPADARRRQARQAGSRRAAAEAALLRRGATSPTSRTGSHPPAARRTRDAKT